MPFLSAPDTVSNGPSAPAVRKPVLLVVDDEEGPRTSLKVVFKNEYDVLLATNGTEAVKIARENKVDIAILDILMHGMSGVDVLRELKQIDEEIEVIMLTAYETLETARQALRLGAREYLNKPFDITALRNAARSALAKRRTNQDLKSAHTRLAQLQAEISKMTGHVPAVRAGDTAGNILHDLNSPLTVINGFIELIHKQVGSAAKIEGEEFEKMKSNIGRVHGQVVRCLEISRRYLGILHPGEGDAAEAVAVNEVLVDLEELLSRHPNAEGCELTISELDAHTHAAISSTNLLRVLLNLALNGLQSGEPPLRVQIIAQAIQEKFDFSRFTNGTEERFITSDRFPVGAEMVAISVRDNGPGIPPAVLTRLFNESFTTKPPGKGTGLGLGSVKQLVTEVHGAIRVTTKPAQGSTFTVFLPLAT
jgi:two-component system sensor histidine kinase/response regulator